MRVIIAGSRDFNNYAILRHNVISVLLELNPTNDIDVEIISGTANGADKLGEKFAQEYNYKLKRFSADWSMGKSAGYKRNEQMALYAKEDDGILLAFWDGQSKGTKHMIDLANKHGLRVYVIKF